LLGKYGIATFSRAYKVFLRRKKINSPTPVADVTGLLITQRKLCTEITYDECITSKDRTTKATLVWPPVDDPSGKLDDYFVGELPFDLTPLFEIPELVDEDSLPASVKPPKPRGRRHDFAFKKGILRMIQQTLLSTSASPYRYAAGSVSYLQTRHFQRRLLNALPKEVLDTPVVQLDFVDAKVKATDAGRMPLRELLSMPSLAFSKRFGIRKNDILTVRGRSSAR
jgi:hypothetical protein